MVLAEATTGTMHKIKEKVWNDRIMESSFARPWPGLDGLKPGFVEDETDIGSYVWDAQPWAGLMKQENLTVMHTATDTTPGIALPHSSRCMEGIPM